MATPVESQINLPQTSKLVNFNKSSDRNLDVYKTPTMRSEKTYAEHCKQKNCLDNRTRLAKTEADVGNSLPTQKITIAQVSEGIKKAEQLINLKPDGNTKQRRNYRKSIIGICSTNNVKTVPKKGYLHVYRCEGGTTPKNLLDCLETTAPHIKFGCEVLKEGDTTTSFKVDFPIQYCKEVYEPKLWPEGAAVRRYTFPKRNFHQEASTMISSR